MRKRGFKMIGGAISALGGGLCPPGMYCMDTSTVLTGLLVLVAIAAIVVFFIKQNAAPTKPTVIVMESKTTQQQVQPPATVINPDPRFAPLSPERSYYVPPDLRGIPIPAGVGPITPVNVQTRGIPDAYQQMGVLTTQGGTDNSATPTRTILPLFGRQLTTNRDRWNYYTRTDGMNPVQVPVQYKRRNCDSDNGCDEIIDGEAVGVPVMGQSFTATVYRYSTPRYLPM
jgi:hypothetical protein